METKGNPVDSVIQYQLHKKTSGEGWDSFKCNYQEPYRYTCGWEDDIEITQELYDSDEIVKLLVDIEEIDIGDVLRKYFIDLSPEIILSGRKLIGISSGKFIVDEYGITNQLILTLSFINDLYILEVDGTRLGIINQLFYNGEQFLNYSITK